LCGLSLLLVLVLAPRVFPPDYPVLLPPQKPTFPNSNWNQWTKCHSVEMPLQISNLFIYLFYFYVIG